MKTAAVFALLLLFPVFVHAQAWSGAEQATVDALLWIQWNQWVQNGFLTVLIFAAIAKR